MGLRKDTVQKDYYQRKGFDDEYDLGDYQFTSLEDIINQFMVVYVGEQKIISKASRIDVAFHAQRALAELSFDTLRSWKAEEIVVPTNLQMMLPHDYVNYVKINWVDSAGIKHLLYPASKTANPRNLYQNSDGEYRIDPVGTLTDGSNEVELDGDYSDVLIHGMRVEATNLPPASYIHNITTTAAGITSITLENKAGTKDKKALATLDERLNITRFNLFGVPMKLGDESLTETTTTAAMAPGDTAMTLTSVDGIKRGMFINHPAFLGGTTVVSVGTSTVITSDVVQPTEAVGSGDTVGFMSNEKTSTTWDSYKSAKPSENNNDDYEDDIYWSANGERYGLDPQYAQTNGSFYIDRRQGKIHFSSNIAGETIILDYISDSLGTDGETVVHKFAEEAIYKCMVHAILSASSYGQALVPRLTKEKFAAVRKAKLRLSNIKLEEITQILRGKSKHIKH